MKAYVVALKDHQETYICLEIRPSIPKHHCPTKRPALLRKESHRCGPRNATQSRRMMRMNTLRTT